MNSTPIIQHWITAVARTADLPDADDLIIDSETDTESAWDLVTGATGTSAEQLAGAVARHFGLEQADLDSATPQAHNLIPASLARRLCVLPLGYSDRTLEVATADPVSLEAERELGSISDRTVVYKIAPPDRIQAAISDIYPRTEKPDREIPPVSADEISVAKILVVDDDPEQRLLLRAALDRGPYEVVTAEDGESALETLDDEGGFNLVTLDLNLPGMQGLDVLQAIRRRPRSAQLPVIVATGYGDRETEILLFEAGADDFIVKPVDPRRLLLRVEAVLRRAGMTIP